MDKKCAIFSASSMDNKKRYVKRNNELIKRLVNHFTIVYGGANTGYMLEVANTVKENQGKLIGVMPTFLKPKELRYENCDEWFETDSMSSRKDQIISMSDCFVALPGGLGTYEEVMDVLSWMHIGLVSKPLVLYNLDNFYEGLLEQIFRGIDDQMISPAFLDSFLVSDDIDEICAFLNQQEEDELLDVYDKNRQLTGRVIKRKNRDQLILNEQFNWVAYLVIKNKNNEVLLQKRNSQKKVFPGQWDLTGGAILASEHSLNAIMRETKEELGLDLSLVNGVYLKHQATIDKSHYDVYEWVVDEDFDDSLLKLQRDEVDEVKWFNYQMVNDLKTLPMYKLMWMFSDEFIL